MQNDIIISDLSVKIIGGTSESLELLASTTNLTSENVTIHGNNTSVFCTENPFTVSGGLQIIKGSAQGNEFYNQVNIQSDEVNIMNFSMDDKSTTLVGPNSIISQVDQSNQKTLVPTESISLSTGVHISGRGIYLSGSIIISLPSPDQAIHPIKIPPIGIATSSSELVQTGDGLTGKNEQQVNIHPTGNTGITGITPPIIKPAPPVFTIEPFTQVNLVSGGEVYLNDVLASLVQQVNLLQAHVTILENKLAPSK